MAERIPEYDDFKLEFARREDGSYFVIAESADGRRVRSSFVPPLTDEELEVLVRDVGLGRRSRRSQQGRLKELEEFGSVLFAALVREQVADVYHGARTAAQGRERGLRITLNLSGAPELMRLPWEFLYLRPRFLSQSVSTPVVRTLDLQSARRPQEVQLPLRILGMVSSPSGYEELDADEERRKLEEALSRLREDGLVELEWLERATLKEFGRRIAEPDEIHVLHYIGHGGYNEATESGVLVLETAHGRANDVSGHTLGSMLQDEESLRLVVLNSCEGALTSRIDPFSGVATSLLEFDVPAVVGMQFEITDEAAIAFSEEFYRQLAHGLPVDAALGPARRAIVAADKGAEFGTPVLFLRSADARLFEPVHPEPLLSESHSSPSSQRALADHESDPAWVEALQSLGAGRRDEAVERLQALAERYPEATGEQERLAEAGRQPDLAAWYAQAGRAAAQGHWAEVVTALERVVATDPDYSDAAERLASARAAEREALSSDSRTHSPLEDGTSATSAKPPIPAQLADVVKGRWYIDVHYPGYPATSMQIVVTSRWGKGRFKATGKVGIPGWAGEGEWEIIPPGDRIVFRGSQRSPYGVGAIQESYSFSTISRDYLEGVNSQGASVVWRRGR